MLSKYEEGLKFEEERLCVAIQCLQTDDLICPICKQYVFHFSINFCNTQLGLCFLVKNV